MLVGQQWVHTHMETGEAAGGVCGRVHTLRGMLLGESVGWRVLVRRDCGCLHACRGPSAGVI